MNTVLVTSATGNIGSKVVSELRDRGRDVRAFTRDHARARTLFGEDVEIVNGDLADIEAVRVAIKGVDAVFLSCGNGPDQLTHERNVIDAAAAVGRARVVKLSAHGADIGSPCAIWDVHARLERRLRDADVPATILRPNFYFSNLFASAQTITLLGQFFLPAGDARVAAVDPRDVAAAAASALTETGHDGRIYHLTGPAALTFDEVATELSGAIGRSVSYVNVPDVAARGAMLDAGMPEWLAENLITLFGMIRGGVMEEVTGDVQHLTGREPRQFSEFAREHAAHFQP